MLGDPEGAEFESPSAQDPERAAYIPPPNQNNVARFEKWLAAGNSPLTLTLRRAANIAALEPHYFSTVFHRRFGESFALWRRRQRVAKAIAELKARRLPVVEVATLVGYRDGRSLERAIKAVTGQTARQLLCTLSLLPCLQEHADAPGASRLRDAPIVASSAQGTDAT
jgi:AraC-like DNA-binding protein